MTAFLETLTPAEQANYKLLLGLSAGGLLPNFRRPEDMNRQKALDTVGEVLTRIQPYQARIPPDGIAYRGRPKLITDNVLETLRTEAREIRHTAQKFDEHFLGCGAPYANEFSRSEALAEFVCAHAGDVSSTGVASFLFYDEEGQGIDPHIDTDIFSLNVLLMLDHRYGKTDRRSQLVVFPRGKEPLHLELEVGEMVIMFAGSTPHGRTRIGPGEAVSILTFGFHPLGI